MKDGDLQEQDRAFLRQVGVVPTGRKPVSVWIAQALCGVLGAVALFFAFRMEGTSAVAVGLLGLLYLALVVGAQKRRPWARWIVVAMLALSACSSVLQSLQASSGDSAEHRDHFRIAPNERSGAAAGRATVVLLLLVLGLRLGFGEPARRYFATSPRNSE